LRIAAAKEHASKLAALHRLDWRERGFGDLMIVPSAPELNAQAAIDRLERELAACQTEPLPVVTESLGWLREHAPKGCQTVLLKGNNGIGEEIWRDGRIIAMSDWELASLGDPASDWAWCQGIKDVAVAGRWGLRDLLDHYEQLSGIHIEEADIEFYKLMQALESIVASANAAVPILTHQNLLARYCWVAIEPMQKGLENLARATGILLPE
jgi:aminoglycoside phosphotransferase (APT) family kinase protein